MVSITSRLTTTSRKMRLDICQRFIDLRLSWGRSPRVDQNIPESLSTATRPGLQKHDSFVSVLFAQESQHKCQQDAQDEASDDGKVEAEVAPADMDIARQAAQPGPADAQPQQGARDHERQARI